MPEQRDVKVFISWSGDLARAVAVALRDWLPLLFDRVEPWASDTDIAAGQRGLAEIERELTDTRFGVVVVTAANQHAPWLNFEAGALGRTIPGDVEQRVVPYLVDLSGPSQVTGPLTQFQAKAANKEGTLALLRSLGAVAGIETRVVDERFDAYWPRLEEKVAAALAADAAQADRPEEPRRDPADVLDEILLRVRALARTDQHVPPVERSDTSGFRRFVERLASEHGFNVSTIKYSGPTPVEIILEPKNGYPYSIEDADAFTLAYREIAIGDDATANVVVIPF